MGCPEPAWDPAISSAAHSQLTGTLASLVFGAIVFILSKDVTARRTHGQAVALLVAGFFTFALDSFIFGVTSGERVCGRAWTETMVAAGLMGIGALGLFTGLAWLLRIHDADNRAAFRATTLAAYLVAIAVGFQLQETAHDYLHDTGAALPSWLQNSVSDYVLAIVIISAAHFGFKRILRRLAPKVVSTTAYITIAYAFVTLWLFSWASGLDPKEWQIGHQNHIAYIAVSLALGLPALTLVLQLVALPGPDESAVPAQPARPDAGPVDDEEATAVLRR